MSTQLSTMAIPGSQPSYPITDPPTGYMSVARTCSFLVNVACDMCRQWIDAGQPKPPDFSWAPADPCPYTSGYNFASFQHSPIIWSSFEYRNSSYTEPFGFLAYNSEAVYLVFRGSQTKVDFDMDLEFEQVSYQAPSSNPPAGMKVEKGFYAVFNGLFFYGDVAKNLTTGLRDLRSSALNQAMTWYITGHSLGSALATLAAPVVVACGVSGMQCNQASPKVGNPAFAQYVDGLGFPMYRLVNTADAVPKLPPGLDYLHAGSEIYFTAAYDAATKEKSEAERHNPCCCYSYALFNPGNPVNPNIQNCVDTPGASVSSSNNAISSKLNPSAPVE
jgi:hypothetical protein